MKNYLLLLVLHIFVSQVFAQTASFSPVTEIPKTDIIGVKKISNESLVLVSGSDENGKITLTFISEQGEKKWISLISVPKLNGYNFNKFQIISGGKKLYAVSQSNEKALLTELNIEDGTILQEEIAIPLSFNVESNPVACYADEKMFYVFSREGKTILKSAYENGAFGSFTEYATFPEELELSGKLFEFEHNAAVYHSAYALNANHRAIRIALKRKQITGEEVTDSLIELNLDQMSFTYNSMFDKSVYSISKGSDGFYIYGKLDLPFDKKYPAEKNSEGFIGIWIAKYDFNFRQIYFRQLPFQNLQNLIPRNAIQKPCVLDIKEDINGHVFFVLNEQKEIFHGSKYILYFDQSGELRSSIGGTDSYHFMEYDQTGLRESGKKYNIKLIYDDWSPYSTSSLHTIPYREDLHSKAIGYIQYLANNRGELPDRIGYNYMLINKEYVLILEFLRKKKGTLLIYHLPI